MTKFQIMWATGNEQCVNCTEKIQQGKPYIRLLQNRWSQPAICKECLEELIKIMNGEQTEMKRQKNKIVTRSYLSNNGWMGGWK